MCEILCEKNCICDAVGYVEVMETGNCWKNYFAKKNLYKHERK